MPSPDHQPPKPSFFEEAYQSFAQPIRWWWKLPRNEWKFWLIGIAAAWVIIGIL